MFDLFQNNRQQKRIDWTCLPIRTSPKKLNHLHRIHVLIELFSSDMPHRDSRLFQGSAVHKSLLGDLNISCKLSDYGANEKHFEDIANAAMSAGQLISNNPRQVTAQDVINILKANLYNT